MTPSRGETPHPRDIDIIRATGIEGARKARGVAVVIDVLRSFTVSAYALAGGARECMLVRTIDEARTLATRIPRSVISAEEDALPVPGIAISNSPTQVHEADLQGRTLIQRSSAGTQVMSALEAVDGMFAASLVVARATAQACLLRHSSTVTLIASADHPEDHACAEYIEGLLRGDERDLGRLLEPLRSSARYQRVSRGEWPGFPATDLDLSLTADRFEFAMPASRHEDHLRVIAQRSLP